MTTITESFNTADSDTLGPDLSWTEIVGDVDIVSNRARGITSGASACRANTDLASADHYAQCKAYVGLSSSSGVGAICRKDSSATLTFYMFWVTYSATYVGTIYKSVGGTVTAIGTANVGVTYSAGDTIKMECNGTTLKAYINGVEVISRTDSSITTGTRCGIRFYDTDGASVAEADDFEAADLAAAVASLIYFQPAITPLLVR